MSDENNEDVAPVGNDKKLAQASTSAEIGSTVSNASTSTSSVVPAIAASSTTQYHVANQDPSDHVCWVCYASEADAPNAEWVNPCRCRGTSKWVHHHCLMRWIDEKQRGQTNTKVHCPQCNTEYIVYFPPLGFLCEGLQLLDQFIFKSSPVLCTGVALTSLYWTATTFGAISVMQILGQEEGLAFLSKLDPLFLLVGLPAFPVLMFCGKLIPWDAYLLRIWRMHAYKVPILNYIFSLEDPAQYRNSLIPRDTEPIREIKFTREFCGAMAFPTIAAVLGKFVYGNIEGNFRRSFLGGMTFVLVKGILKIYLQQRVYTLSSQRRVAEFREPPRDRADGPSQQPIDGPNRPQQPPPPQERIQY